ncbi:MAG: 5-(carboxyamino)imidazole ribonucleotide mutase [Candidatus Omnitrophota bacterium]|nr:MAG: 5-(carboxyamino)imidazole ribonucleotide mutase [Candidatus Omnitrophota bacterium]
MKYRSKVSIIMGSKSDAETVEETVKILKKFEIAYELKILSAHRNPDQLVKYVKTFSKTDVQVVIAAAGMSAALAGAIAAHTILPVIGVPMHTKTLEGMDSLLSTVQMPRGIPVACMSIGASGACNAGILACQILALNDRVLRKKLDQFKNLSKK